MAKFIIAVLHLILLFWMLKVLSLSGHWEMSQTMLHFVGMGLYGFGLIFGTARWARNQHILELNQKALTKSE